MNEQKKKKFTFGWKLPVGMIVGIIVGFALHWAVRPAGLAVPGEPVAGAAEHDHEQETVWTCSMHPQVRLPNPGLCPICNMELIPLVQEDEADLMPGFAVFTTSKAAAALMDLETTPVERRFPTAEIRMVGKVDYDETRVEYITAWVPGRLDKLYVDYTGVPVQEGDHMVYMYSPELLSAQEELIQALKARQNIQQSQSEIIREVTSGTVQAVREKLRLMGLSESQIAEIEQRGTASDHITIYAPTSGIVVHKNAKEGMYVDTGTRIYTVADLSHVWVRLDAYESDLAWLRYGQPVEFTTVSYPGQVFEGIITFIDPILNPQTRTVKVRVDVPNPDGLLKPEMFVRAVVRAEVAAGGKVMDPNMAGKWICPMHPSQIEEAPGDCDICGMPLVRTENLGYTSVQPGNVEIPLVIPASAALVTGKRAVVYVEVPEADKPTFAGREVVLGPRAGDYYIVLSGLEEGQEVVTKGNFKIDSALQIQAKPSMMMPKDDQVTAEEAPPVPVPKLELSQATRQEFQAIYDAYFNLQQALFNDDFPAADAAVEPLKEAMNAVDMAALSENAHAVWMTHLNALEQILARMAEAEAIEPFRQAFSLLSEELYTVGLQFGAPGDAPIYQLNCPMAFDNRGANWLQPDVDVRNPYFGAVMPKCGSVVDVIAPPTQEETGGPQHD